MGPTAAQQFYRNVWNELEPAERKRREATAARNGCLIRDGLAVVPAYRRSRGNGQTEVLVRPLHFRLRALRGGDPAARAYCQLEGIPLETMTDGDFRVWEARYLGREREVAETPPPAQSRPLRAARYDLEED